MYVILFLAHHVTPCVLVIYRLSLHTLWTCVVSMGDLDTCYLCGRMILSEVRMLLYIVIISIYRNCIYL